MIDYIKEQRQLFLLISIWIIVGVYLNVVVLALIPITVYLMVKKEMHEELLIGYLVVLILSDSLEDKLYFAKNVKNIYIAMLGLFILFNGKSFKPMHEIYKVFIPFFLFSIVTVLFSVNDAFFFTSVQKTISFALSFIIIPNLILKLYRKDGYLFFRRLIFFFFYSLILGFVLKYVSHDIAYLSTGRYRGILGNPNGLGIYGVLVFILFFILNDIKKDLFSKNEKIIIYTVIIISILMTNSRNAMLAVLIFFLFQKFFALSPFLGFLIFLVTLAASEFISNNFTSIIVYLGLGDFFRVRTLEEGSGRYIAWEFAWKQIQHNFFIGKGFGYDEFYMRQNYGMLQRLGHQGGVHNSFLTFWMDQGLIGLLIYLRSYILMFIRSSKNTKYAFPVMFAITFTAVFESWLVGSLSVFAALAMIIFTFIYSKEFYSSTDENEENLILKLD